MVAHLASWYFETVGLYNPNAINIWSVDGETTEMETTTCIDKHSR